MADTTITQLTTNTVLSAENFLPLSMVTILQNFLQIVY